MKDVFALVSVGLVSLTVIAVSCGGSSSSSASSVGAAIGGLFAGSGEAMILPVENDTCGEFEGESGSGGGPEGVSTSAEIAAGTYGSASASVTVTAEDDCESDAEGAYASFQLTADVVGSCTSGGNVTMKSGSAGIFRNTDEYEPEIFGTFTFIANGTTYSNLRCTIRMNGEGSVVTSVSSCEDSAGDPVSLASSDSCTFGN